MDEGIEIPPYTLACSKYCTLKEGSVFGKTATEALLRGESLRSIISKAHEVNIKISLSTLQNHKRHILLKPTKSEEKASAPANIEILQEIIQKGFENRKNWRPTISDTMKAMDMWFKLTSGNPFDELLDALADAALGEENPEAIRERNDPSDPSGDGFEDGESGEDVFTTLESRPGDNLRTAVETGI